MLGVYYMYLGMGRMLQEYQSCDSTMFIPHVSPATMWLNKQTMTCHV